MTTRKKLPIGIQTFEKIRQSNVYYVDKTRFAVDLVEHGSYYFLSRPRRFGKSLFLDTLKELFEGNAALFTGLAAENRWDWSTKYPVIRFSFGGGVLGSVADAQSSINQQLSFMEEAFSLPTRYPDLRGRFKDLIVRIADSTHQRVVILVDEYDKPILDRIEEPQTAAQIREVLKDLYSVIKDSDAYIKFAFLTGVSKFSKVSLFSGLNNLQDITLDARYSDICGYTETDIDSTFSPELFDLDRQRIKDWYNGYNWLGTSVYNPFDILLLFDTRSFRAHWFETGTPTFLIKLLQQRQTFTPDLGRSIASDTLLSTFDVDTIPTETLMFQTGYLTIASVDHIPGLMELTLKYPNLEVQASLNNCLLESLTNSRTTPIRHISKLYKLLSIPDFAGLQGLFQSFYASIANDWYRKNEMSTYEGYYVSIFYSYFAALGLDIHVEDPTNHGRIDMTVKFHGHIFLFEFKVVEMEPEGKALEQLQKMGYAEKYRSTGQPIHLIGVEFSKKTRNIVGFAVA
ncbi:ATP-binding protein [Candidatus Symbiobacter mobilis]|uniref:ATP-binding protein n=1 Tax=Candidatus Symbiobacter mobilis TaxID=1436290 RepID=UPI00059C349D|nr:ATP-binding protein [Candidatus Symbiobacter mobilis]